MKVKTSITLSGELLKAIDRQGKRFRSRSEFLECAARGYLAHLARAGAARRDLEIMERHADALSAEALDVLAYQAPL